MELFIVSAVQKSHENTDRRIEWMLTTGAFLLGESMEAAVR